ncbi:MAG: T9SS type A sorting domain-containing protein [Flavobacteriales bacterium]|nr:T9SS type A sorting domain-containing protein [Flavobacteriales bacterium]
MTFLFLLAALGVRAQTFFYIDSISVQPTAPTTSDAVVLSLSGGLASTGAQVTNVSATVVGDTITIAITAQDNGGLTVIVPHTEVVNIGTLATGTYSIVIAGQAVDDLASAPQHQFSVSGGGSCAGLELVSIKWHALTDTAIMVNVQNNNGTQFDYPNFILYNATGDTIAKESVNFFGITEESWHRLNLLTGTVAPANLFNGRLELWTGFTTSLACSWDLPIDLCPSTSCSTVHPYIINLGGATASGTFNWGILQGGNVVESGTFTINEDQQIDLAEPCLPPGEYTMICGGDGGPTVGTLYYGLGAGNLQETVLQPTNTVIPIPIPFSLYQPCAALVQVPPVRADGSKISLLQEPGLITLLILNAEKGHIRILDTQGRTVHTSAFSSERHTIATSAWSKGLYTAVIQSSQGQRTALRVVVQ